jgi:hypothetical protein
VPCDHACRLSNNSDNRADRLIAGIHFARKRYNFEESRTFEHMRNRERRMRTVPVVVCLFAGFAIQSGLGTADARQRRLASETRVEQARGNMPVGSKTIDGGGPVRGIPEGGSGAGALKTGPTAPITCNQQNASSPACYSATQQARPPAR